MSRLRPFTWALLTGSLIVGLAALVRIADPRASTVDDLTGVIRLPWVVTWTVILLLGIAALVFFVDVVRRMRSRRHGDEDEAMGAREEQAPRPPWLVALTQIMSIVNFVVIVYLLWKNVLPFTDLMGLGQGLGAASSSVQERAPDAPLFFTWTFAIVALLGGCGALALALWITSSDRLAKWWAREDEPAPPPLVEAVEESLEDLRAEPDARRAIIRCYARFERAAADSGLHRRPWHTPMEFMREALSHLPAPRSAVTALTSLFELARFSDRALGAAERDRALDALDDIKAAIDAERADAVAR